MSQYLIPVSDGHCTRCGQDGPVAPVGDDELCLDCDRREFERAAQERRAQQPRGSRFVDARADRPGLFPWEGDRTTPNPRAYFVDFSVGEAPEPEQEPPTRCRCGTGDTPLCDACWQALLA